MALCLLILLLVLIPPGLTQLSNTTSPPEFHGCEQQDLDLVFVLDSSGSVNSSNFLLVKDFVKRFLQTADIDGDKVRVGVIRFSSTQPVQFHLNSYNTKADVFKAIDRINYRSGSTNTADALETMRTKMFTEGRGDRPDVPNVAFVVTDGVSNVNSRDTIPQVELAMDAGIHIYAIGVGISETTELNGIASKPVEKNRFDVNDFTDLRVLRDQLFTLLCVRTTTEGALTTTSALPHGPGCNRLGRYCVKDANCVRHKGHYQCECPNGTTGNGYIECVDQGSHFCAINDDPHITPFYGERLDFTLPCWFRLTAVRIHVTSLGANMYLEVDILGENILTSDGLYFVDKLKIQVKLVRRRRRTQQYTLIDTKTWTITSQDFFTSLGLTPWKVPPLETWNGLTFAFDWDDFDLFATWTPTFVTGWRVKFRAHNPFQKPQLLSPGLSVVVPTTSVDFLYKFDESVCMTFGMPEEFIHNMAERWGIRPPSLLTLHYALLQPGVDQFDNKQCKLSRDLLQNCQKHPKLAVKYCGFILNYKRTRKCLLDACQDPMKVFARCVKWVCQGRKRLCRRVRNLLMKKTKCDTAATFRIVRCSRKRLAKANQRILDVEGNN